MKLILVILSAFIFTACDRIEDAREMDEVNFERQEEYDDKDLNERKTLPIRKGGQIDTKDAPWPSGEAND